MSPEARTELVAVRLSKQEAAMLQELADLDGVYQSDVIRLLVRKEHRERFGVQKAKPRKKR
jgi:hypothetical protein